MDLPTTSAGADTNTRVVLEEPEACGSGSGAGSSSTRLAREGAVVGWGCASPSGEHLRDIVEEPEAR